MRTFAFAFSSFAVALMSLAAQAASFSIVGSDTGGQLRILYDPAPQGATFADGSLRLSLTSSRPGVIKFTGATIVDAAARWGNAVQVLDVTDDAIGQLNAFSVGNPGLPANAISTFATVDYELLPGCGLIQLTLGTQGEDPLYDGIQGDVSGSVAFYGVTYLCPEPGGFALTLLGLSGLALLRCRC